MQVWFARSYWRRHIFSRAIRVSFLLAPKPTVLGFGGSAITSSKRRRAGTRQVERELLQRQNRRLERVLKAAKLRSGAVVEDLDFSSTRGLNKTTLRSLVDSPWVENHHQVIIVGPTGVGKTFLACAVANHAIRHGATALYVRVPRILDDLSVARADGRLARMMSSLARVDVLILDDLLLRPHFDDQAADLLEVVEDRRGRSIIATLFAYDHAVLRRTTTAHH